MDFTKNQNKYMTQKYGFVQYLNLHDLFLVSTFEGKCEYIKNLIKETEQLKNQKLAQRSAQKDLNQEIELKDQDSINEESQDKVTA